MVAIKGTANTTTETCDFCRTVYTPKRLTPDALKHCCGKKQCLREYDRQRKMKLRDSVDLEDWDAVTERFQPGEVIAEFDAVISGGRFTASGGAQLTLTVSIAEKYKLVDATDYSGQTVHAVLTRQVVKDDTDDTGDADADE